ncbi:MAG: DUF4230 domain-containing protein [Fimbriimonadales bacterium]
MVWLRVIRRLLKLRRYGVWLVVLMLGGILLTIPGWHQGLLARLSALTQAVYRTQPSPTVIVNQLQRLNRLETARQITTHTVAVEATNGLPLWLAGERVLLIATAEAVAGIDLSQIQPHHIRVEGKRVWLELPEPQLLRVMINEGRTQVYDRQRGLFVFQPDREIESRARQQALLEARQAALQGELMSLARQNATEELRRLLNALGFEEVQFGRSMAHEPRFQN